MAVSLYDLSVRSYLQGLSGVSRVLQKGREHCATAGVSAEALVETRFWEDMRPFQFQIQSVAHHSIGAIEGLKRGEFSPPPAMETTDYAGLQHMVSEAETALRQVSPAELEALAGRAMWFRAGERQLEFTTETFLLGFSLPNFYFHAVTAYDLLRSTGVPLAKRDYIGRRPV